MNLDIDNLPEDWLEQLGNDMARRMDYCIGKNLVIKIYGGSNTTKDGSYEYEVLDNTILTHINSINFCVDKGEECILITFNTSPFVIEAVDSSENRTKLYP